MPIIAEENISFYDKYENTLSRNTIVYDNVTSDEVHNTNYNSNFLLSRLNDFYDLNHIEVTMMEQFNEEIYQRVVYENILEFSNPFIRESYTITKPYNVSTTIPFDYDYAYQYDSIILAGINYFNYYLNDKFEYFDFTVMNDKLSRMDSFYIFNFYLKIINLLDCTMYKEIQNNLENLFEMLEDMPLKDKINRVKDKAYVAIIWNNLLSYLSKCNADLHECFISQSWDFIGDYITNRI